MSFKLELPNGKKVTSDEFKLEKQKKDFENARKNPSEELKNQRPDYSGSNGSTKNIESKGMSEQIKKDIKTLRTETALDTLDGGTKTKQIHFITRKALESYDFVSGGSLAPEGWSQEILRRQALEARIKNAIGFSTFDTKELIFPMDNTAWNAQIVGEGEISTESVIATDDRTLTPSKIMINTTITSEWDEDSFPNAISEIEGSIARALARAEERLILFPATGGLQATARATLAEVPFDITTPDTAFTTETDVLEILTLLDTGYQAEASEIIWIADARLRPRMLSLPRFQDTDNVNTLAGSEIFFTDVLEPSGTGGLGVMAVNKRTVRIGQRRGLKITSIPERGDKRYMEVTMRSGLLLPYLDAGLNVGSAIRYFTV